MYVSDLDGTLLRADGQLSRRSRDILGRMLEEGVPFTVASARSAESIRPLLAGVPLTLPVVAFNGAVVTDLATGRHETVWALDPSVARDTVELCVERRLGPFLTTHDGTRDRLHYAEVTNPAMAWHVKVRTLHGDRRLAHGPDLEPALREQVIGISAMGVDEAAIQRLAEDLTERHGAKVLLYPFENRYAPGHHWVTIVHPAATKGRALTTLRSERGLGSQPLTVFGDDHNDLPMFAIADRAVAVANAAPAVKARATHQIGHHDEDSVASFLEAELAGDTG